MTPQELKAWNNCAATIKSELMKLRDVTKGPAQEGISMSIDLVEQLTINK